MKQTVLNSTAVPGVLFLYYLAVATAMTSGVFCVLFLAILLNNYFAPYSPEKLDRMIAESGETGVSTALAAPRTVASGADIDPTKLAAPSTLPDEHKSPFNLFPSDYKELVDLRRQLMQDTGNTAIRERIRVLDQQLRVEYFRRREIAAAGAPFLLLAACFLVFSARIAAVLNRKLPVPGSKDAAKQRNEDSHFAKYGLVAVCFVGAVCFGIALGLLSSERSELARFLLARGGIEEIEERGSGIEKEPATEQPAVVDWKPTANWPTFRGADGSGISTAKNPPLHWNVETGENILWKSEISLPGHSSPILWNDRIFLTGADEHQRKVYCFDKESGTLLWDYELEARDSDAVPLQMGVNLNEDTGYAAPTPATDGERVYAIFATCDLVALDFDGNLVWSKNLGVPDNHYGYAASLAFYKDRLLVQYDQGDGRKANESKLIAFKGSDGSVVWETPRTMMNSWPSPIVRKIGDKFQLLTGADPFLISYDPETGQELWRCKAYSSGDTAASPTGFGTTVFAANGQPGITAVDATASGDLTGTDKRLWLVRTCAPDACSPIATEKYLYSLGPGAFLQCIEIASGEVIWELEIDDYATFYSSPSLADGKIYLFDKESKGAKAYIIDPEKAVQEGQEKEMILAVNPMGEPIFASPAFSDGRIYIRSETTLYCIGTP
ncbi:MAG: PQQ-binding-like beta-propeller repeat protein [Planctomycetaceae bacterium]|nr:PQQ-binding-like beta-propeller repeat protein [Planctomycetaceae bacterium]